MKSEHYIANDFRRVLISSRLKNPHPEPRKKSELEHLNLMRWYIRFGNEILNLVVCSLSDAYMVLSLVLRIDNFVTVMHFLIGIYFNLEVSLITYRSLNIFHIPTSHASISFYRIRY